MFRIRFTLCSRCNPRPYANQRSNTCRQAVATTPAEQTRQNTDQNQDTRDAVLEQRSQELQRLRAEGYTITYPDGSRDYEPGIWGGITDSWPHLMMALEVLSKPSRDALRGDGCCQPIERCGPREPTTSNTLRAS